MRSKSGDGTCPPFASEIQDFVKDLNKAQAKDLVQVEVSYC